MTIPPTAGRFLREVVMKKNAKKNETKIAEINKAISKIKNKREYRGTPYTNNELGKLHVLFEQLHKLGAL